MLNPGDEVLVTNDLYGGTYRIFTKVFAKYGIKFVFKPMQDTSSIESFINENTKLVWMETPTNPVMRLIDIEEICAIAKTKNVQTVVDNTFASPYLQTPLKLGATIVLHSVTKYLGGHSDTVMGTVITSDESIHEQIRFVQNAVGAVPGPQDCFLVLRGIKTLGLRMRQHSKNAMAVAKFLEESDKVAWVNYPGLTSHPDHELAKKQMRDFGGMVSFSLKNDSMEEAIKLLKALKVFSLAESLGGVESLIGHPATMTHASIPKEQRMEAGLTDSLLRLSVGIEDEEDLIEDLKNALNVL
jgi:cystathionine beta-lyase